MGPTVSERTPWRVEPIGDGWRLVDGRRAAHGIRVYERRLRSDATMTEIVETCICDDTARNRVLSSRTETAREAHARVRSGGAPLFVDLSVVDRTTEPLSQAALDLDSRTVAEAMRRMHEQIDRSLFTAALPSSFGDVAARLARQEDARVEADRIVRALEGGPVGRSTPDRPQGARPDPPPAPPVTGTPIVRRQPEPTGRRAMALGGVPVREPGPPPPEPPRPATPEARAPGVDPATVTRYPTHQGVAVEFSDGVPLGIQRTAPVTISGTFDDGLLDSFARAADAVSRRGDEIVAEIERQAVDAQRRAAGILSPIPRPAGVRETDRLVFVPSGRAERAYLWSVAALGVLLAAWLVIWYAGWWP